MLFRVDLNEIFDKIRKSTYIRVIKPQVLNLLTANFFPQQFAIIRSSWNIVKRQNSTVDIGSVSHRRLSQDLRRRADEHKAEIDAECREDDD